MITVTKIFRFEMAHAIFGYSGKCKNIHGHSYVLHVTVTNSSGHNDFIPGSGFIMDFKELKKIVNEKVIQELDHRLVLSDEYLKLNRAYESAENILKWNVEPSAENILIYVKQQIETALPEGIKLIRLKLYETADSYAQWIA
jgi:6-pyruvoyltetrahydropterin/6-carboxytetrahydropterin synthase